VLSVLREQAAWQVEEAWDDLISRGPGWRSRAKKGRDALVRVAPELDAAAWLPLPGKAAGQ
ncbi:hypothetical protein ABTF51_20210, partial [Acinetobacter baumannii]